MKTLQLDPSVEFQAVKLAEGSTSLYLSQLSLHQSLIFFFFYCSVCTGLSRCLCLTATNGVSFSFVRSFQDFKEGNTLRNREHESTLASRDHKPEVVQGG